MSGLYLRCRLIQKFHYQFERKIAQINIYRQNPLCSQVLKLLRSTVSIDGIFKTNRINKKHMKSRNLFIFLFRGLTGLQYIEYMRNLGRSTLAMKNIQPKVDDRLCKSFNSISLKLRRK